MQSSRTTPMVLSQPWSRVLPFSRQGPALTQRGPQAWVALRLYQVPLNSWLVYSHKAPGPIQSLPCSAELVNWWKFSMGPLWKSQLGDSPASLAHRPLCLLWSVSLVFPGLLDPTCHHQVIVGLCFNERPNDSPELQQLWLYGLELRWPSSPPQRPHFNLKCYERSVSREVSEKCLTMRWAKCPAFHIPTGPS